MATNVTDSKGNKYNLTLKQFRYNDAVYTAEEVADKPELVDELAAIGLGGLTLITEGIADAPKGNGKKGNGKKGTGKKGKAGETTDEPETTEEETTEEPETTEEETTAPAAE